jgi:hypothetical protein
MRYRAFVSYSHADRVLGERFQKAIERYRLPKSLRGTDRGFGPIPKFLTPLFRDRSDARAGPDLSGALRRALEDAETLIPLCSPAAARSAWVNGEIRTFKALGRSQRIFPVVLNGTPRRYDPDTAPDGAFPPALFQRVDAAGGVVAEDAPEPIAADARPVPLGDGFDHAKLKVIAGLTGVPLTELTQRHLEAERRERHIVRLIASAMTALAVAAIVAAVVAYRSALAARDRLADAINMAATRVDDAVALVDTYGVPTRAVNELLVGAEEGFRQLLAKGYGDAPMLELERGRLLSVFAGHYALVGDTARQAALATEAVAVLARVPSSRSLTQPGT